MLVPIQKRSPLCSGLLFGAIAVSCLLANRPALTADKPTVAKSATEVKVTLPHQTELVFALHEGHLLGLRKASVQGVDLTSSDTVLRPVLAQEFAKGRRIWQVLRFKEAVVKDGSVHISCELLGDEKDQAFRSFFVYAGNRSEARKAKLPGELTAPQKTADAAAATLDGMIKSEKGYLAYLRKIQDIRTRIEGEKDKGKKKKLQRSLKGLTSAKQQKRNRKAAQTRLLAENPEAAALQKKIDRFEEALGAYALKHHGRIHRDYYRFAHTRQPAEICRIEYVRERTAEAKDLKANGKLTWIITPVTRNVAGWAWHGWKHQYAFELGDDRKVNCIRQLGTWEPGGEAPGNAVINLRYRGLGRLEQSLTADGKGGVREAFTTTEVMPGAVGGAPLVSPVVPRSKEKMDRGYALMHRAGAWICHMARGAGHGFVDFIYRPNVALCTFYDRQGNLRALTESFPGDRQIGFTEEEWFALTNRFTTEPQVYLALVRKEKPLKAHEWRTRWKEVDQDVRDRLAKELNFLQRDVLPGVGLLSDYGWAGQYRYLANGGAKAWAEKGVRLIAYHNPGWVNGRYQGPKNNPKTPKRTGGGVCNVYDWWPCIDIETPWRDFQKACTKEKIAFYPWLGQTVWRDAPFAKRVGYEKPHWSLNTPHDTHGPGYGAENMKGNVQNKRFREVFLGQMEKLRKEVGYQGWWADSFQNLFMSQLAWSDGSGNSLQRGWWEIIAEWTRQGVGWMGESHSVPGMSCSIEVAGWDEQPWLMQHVWKWLRGSHQSHFKPAKVDEITFRVMSNRGWVAPDHSNGHNTNFYTPGFARLANEYLAALPHMQRPYLLGDNKGVLWLGAKSDHEGVLFAYTDIGAPEGVVMRPIRESGKGNAQQAKALYTYAVEGKDLAAAFGVRRGPEKDPRLGRVRSSAPYTWTIGDDGEK